MARILLITHGELGKAFITVIKEMLKKPVAVELLSFFPDQKQDDFSNELKKAMDQYEPSEEILILTDLFGGTPSNMAIPYLEQNRVEVITGVNLAMLLHLVTGNQSKSFAELCQSAKSAGVDSVVRAGEFL